MRYLELRLQASEGNSHAVSNTRSSSSSKAASGLHRGLAEGRCHICRDLAPVEHLLAVGHWICLRCETRFMGRGVEFMRAMVQGESLDCCGPIARLG